MSVLSPHIALVSEPPNYVGFDQLAQVSAAIQKQVHNDFQPIWQLSATVDCFDKVDHAPPDSWLIILQDKIEDPAVSGIHKINGGPFAGQPYALVHAGPDSNWSLTVSHEALEMIVDPYGSKTCTAPPPPQAPPPISTFSLANFLFEICDPCEDLQFGYAIDSVTVSDFVTPDYYNHRSRGTRCSFRGHVQQPYQVLEGGYLSFQNILDNQWYNISIANQQVQTRNLGILTPVGAKAVRELVDRAVRRARKRAYYRIRNPGAPADPRPFRPSNASVARAKSLRDSITKLK